MKSILSCVRHFTVVTTGGLVSIYTAFSLLDGVWSSAFGLIGIGLMTSVIYPAMLVAVGLDPLPSWFYRWTYRLGLVMSMLSGTLILLNLPWLSSTRWFAGLMTAVIGLAFGLAVWLNNKTESHDAKRRGGRTIYIYGDPS